MSNDLNDLNNPLFCIVDNEFKHAYLKVEQNLSSAKKYFGYL